MNTNEVKRVLEAALLCSPDPLSMTAVRRLFDNEFGPEVLRPLLDDLAADWSQRPVQLVQVASGWRFQSRPEYATYINRLSPEKAPRYSRAVMETLAIVAYRQPVTRGDIEEIRGVSVSAQIIKTLEERGWIDMIGHKDVPGRPSLFGTTRQFLDDLGLRSLKELPSIDTMGDDDTADIFSSQVVALTAVDAEVVRQDDDDEGSGADSPESGERAIAGLPEADVVTTPVVAVTEAAELLVTPESLEIDELVELAESLNLVATLDHSASAGRDDNNDDSPADQNPVPNPMETR